MENMINNDDTMAGEMRFFIYSDGRQHGPYDVRGLKEHGLSSETLVWRDGMDGWMPAWRVDELKPVLAGKDGKQAVPLPVPPQEETPGDGDEADMGAPVVPAVLRKGRRTRRNVILAVLALLLIIMSLTCPGKDAHKAAVSEEVKEVVNKMAEDDSPWGVIGGMMVSGMAAIAVDQMLDVDDYVFFSIGSVHYGDRSRAVSFGIFNHVFTFDSEYVRQSMTEN